MLGEVLTATVTPFDADGAVDYERYHELCAFLVDNGSDGVVVSGTTGESPTLSEDERVELLRVAIDAIGDRATVQAHAHIRKRLRQWFGARCGRPVPHYLRRQREAGQYPRADRRGRTSTARSSAAPASRSAASPRS